MYDVSVKCDSDGKWTEFNCNCQFFESARYCKHIVTFLLFISEVLKNSGKLPEWSTMILTEQQQNQQSNQQQQSPERKADSPRANARKAALARLAKQKNLGKTPDTVAILAQSRQPASLGIDSLNPLLSSSSGSSSSPANSIPTPILTNPTSLSLQLNKDSNTLIQANDVLKQLVVSHVQTLPSATQRNPNIWICSLCLKRQPCDSLQCKICKTPNPQ